MNEQYAEGDGAYRRAVLACKETVSRLVSAGVPPEALAEYVPARRAFLHTKRATMRPIGEVWRMGPLLLGTNADLYVAGLLTRAAERGRPGYQSVSREERREIAAAALSGGYLAGTPVNYGAVLLTAELILNKATAPAHDGSELPVGISNGEVRVRWRVGTPLDGAPTLSAFLAERSELLIRPPEEST